MKQIVYILYKRLNRIFAAMACLVVLASCDSVLQFDEGECIVVAPEYRIRFKYDYNMKYADAFANEVQAVTLYAFDDNGKFVYQTTEDGEKLKVEGYTMKFDIDPGDYHLVSWAGLVNQSFAVPLLIPGVSTIDELTAKTNRTILNTRTGEGGPIVNEKLASLWHGECQRSFTRAATQEVITIPLVKNTNSIRIILQQMQGYSVDVSNFDFSITDDNGWMNYDNSLLNDEELTYLPYYKAQGTTQMVDPDGTTRAAAQLSVAVAQLTTGRLVVDQHPVLRITNKATGKVVLAIPLIDYLLLTEQEGHNMEPQEYLDRQDEYSMTFFLDENMEWINAQIIVNGWTIRLNEADDI